MVHDDVVNAALALEMAEGIETLAFTLLADSSIAFAGMISFEHLLPLSSFT
jgi:hypothetical protein